MTPSLRHDQLARRLLEALGSSRVIPLSKKHEVKIHQTPLDFHSTLINQIQNAKKHISLASLYIGHGASQQEQQLLQALKETKVPTKILMDVNRATRPVKINPQLASGTAGEPNESSCAQAVQSVLSSPLHLYQVLSPWLSRLPSPLNEIMGVFHLKSYIVDDEVILSGANLSTEYFDDRQDRYVSFREPELVNFYKELVEVLCDHSGVYGGGNDHEEASGGKLKDSLGKLFAPSGTLPPEDDSNVVAYAIPTLQIPNVSLPFPSDVQQLSNVLAFSSEFKNCSVNLASAYLNPTPTFLESLDKERSTLLTAGPQSHGFAAKPGVKRKGDFVPKFFDAQNYNLQQDYNLRLYQRPGWTFHSKGMWVINNETDKLVAAVVGSGNYGYRSERRDLESNLILVFPNEDSKLQDDLMEEWERLVQHAEAPTFQKPQPLIRTLWPLIQTYF